jgi:hypothetical protein
MRRDRRRRARRRVGGAGPPRLALPRRRHGRGRDPAGVQSVNARWGNLKAILAGDFLLAKASEIAASLGTEVAGLLAATIGRLCEGQVGELRTAYDVGRTEEAYLASIEGKTASLFATACRIGAHRGRLPRARRRRSPSSATRYGMASRSSTTCSTSSPPTPSSASRRPRPRRGRLHPAGHPDPRRPSPGGGHGVCRPRAARLPQRLSINGRRRPRRAPRRDARRRVPGCASAERAGRRSPATATRR